MYCNTEKNPYFTVFLTSALCVVTISCSAATVYDEVVGGDMANLY